MLVSLSTLYDDITFLLFYADFDDADGLDAVAKDAGFSLTRSLSLSLS